MLSATMGRDAGGPSLGRRLVRKAGAALGLIVSSVIVALGAAELLIRLVAPQQLIRERPDMCQPVDSLGWAHRPGADTRINTGERTVRWITDRRGFRVGSGGAVESNRAVLLLGDSYMAAMQVDYEQSFAGLMERRLREALGVVLLKNELHVVRMRLGLSARYIPWGFRLKTRAAEPGT